MKKAQQKQVVTQGLNPFFHKAHSFFKVLHSATEKYAYKSQSFFP